MIRSLGNATISSVSWTPQAQNIKGEKRGRERNKERARRKPKIEGDVGKKRNQGRRKTGKKEREGRRKIIAVRLKRKSKCKML